MATGAMAAGCMTVPEEDPVWAKTRENDQRLERIERVMDNNSLLELVQQGNNLVTPVFDKAPPVVQKTLIFPYTAGLEFVTYLRQSRPVWRPVNQAYARPPVSTEQVLHPEKYLSNEAPVPVSFAPSLAIPDDDWELVMEDVLGEFLLRTYLESSLAPPAAARAAGGWGGDRFRLYRDGSGHHLFVALIEWDTALDAREFFDAFQQLTDSKGNWEKRGAQTHDVRWSSPDRSVLLRQAGDRTVIGIGPDPGSLELIATALTP